MYEIYCDFHENVIWVKVTKNTNVDQNQSTNRNSKKKRFKNQCSPTNALLVVAGQAFSSNFKGIALSISAIYH